MNLLVTCSACFMARGRPDFTTLRLTAIPDDRVVRFECPHGHVNHTVLQNEKFELLSEMAVKAIVDEYYREAVLNFKAMLERLFEYYFHIVAIHREVPLEAVTIAWKPMSNMSERQMGAFLALYACEHGLAPPVLPRAQDEFRNDVVHKGHFPTRETTVSFGKACFAVADQVLHRVKEQPYYAAAEKRRNTWIINTHRAADEVGATGATAGLNTPVHLWRSEPAVANLDAAIAEMAARPEPDGVTDFSRILGAAAEIIRPAG